MIFLSCRDFDRPLNDRPTGEEQRACLRQGKYRAAEDTSVYEGRFRRNDETVEGRRTFPQQAKTGMLPAQRKPIYDGVERDVVPGNGCGHGWYACRCGG